MTLTVEQLRRYRKRFAWLFLVSAVLLAVSCAYIWFTSPARVSGVPSSAGGIFEFTSESISLPIIVSIASLLASLASLLGFFTTTALALRKDEREQQQAALDVEQKRLEIEKLRRELAGKDVPGNHTQSR
jgi:hypothetical protein